jgi:protein-tyrosine-phosphatase
LDGDQPSALAIVRSLGRQGVTVHVASSVERPLAASSRYAGKPVRYPDPLRDGAAFVAWIQARQQQHPHELIFPVTERTVVPLMLYRAQLDEQRLAIAPTAALEQVLAKDKTMAVAESLQIPIPKSIHVSNLAEASDAAQVLGYPLVIKPARSVGQDASGHVQLAVSYAQTPAELKERVTHTLQFGQVVLQEYFAGEGVGVEVIANQGEVQYAFQHRRLHEVPLTGGGSSLRVSEAVAPDLLEASRKLLRAIGWHGVAMVEFKHNPATGAFRLIEINGRFWGSLPLAVAAGADFPFMLYELMTTGRVGPHPAAEVGILGRLLTRDLLWLEHVMRQSGAGGVTQIPTRADALRDSFKTFSRLHRFDVQSWSDPWPGLVDLGRIGRQYWDRLAGVVVHRWRLFRAWRGSKGALQNLSRTTAAERVLFVCYGNINRSAVAHVHARAHYGDRWQIRSAGFHAQGQRAADPNMVKAASAHGIDLSEWRSHCLSAADVEQADVILAMELAHIERLAALHPGARSKCHLLAAPIASSAPEAEIADPYGKAPQAYDRACTRVIQSVDRWLKGRSAQPASATTR